MLSPKERRAEFINTNNFTSAFLGRVFCRSFRVENQGGPLVIDNSRRKFILAIPAFVGLAVLTACQGINSVLAPEDEFVSKQTFKSVTQTVADFLQAHYITSYSNNSDWMIEGSLLISLGDWGEGQYKYFVNGQYMTGPIKLCAFDPSSDHLYIEKMINGYWEKIWSWPHQGTHYNIQEQVIPES